MVKLSQCERCLLCAHEPLIVCAVQPDGPTGDTCLDFRVNPDLEVRKFVDFLGLQRRQNREEITNGEPFSNPFDLEPDEELWEPEGASYYAGELILQPQQRWTQEEQLELLDTYPLFTGKCPACNWQFPEYEKKTIHWDCPCGWIDDTVWDECSATSVEVEIKVAIAIWGWSMWLRYGVDADNTLVAIEDTRSGKTNLGCPYCRSRLIAKKGRVKEHVRFVD